MPVQKLIQFSPPWCRHCILQFALHGSNIPCQQSTLDHNYLYTKYTSRTSKQRLSYLPSTCVATPQLHNLLQNWSCHHIWNHRRFLRCCFLVHSPLSQYTNPTIKATATSSKNAIAIVRTDDKSWAPPSGPCLLVSISADYRGISREFFFWMEPADEDDDVAIYEGSIIHLLNDDHFIIKNCYSASEDDSLLAPVNRQDHVYNRTICSLLSSWNAYFWDNRGMGKWRQIGWTSWVF